MPREHRNLTLPSFNFFISALADIADEARELFDDAMDDFATIGNVLDRFAEMRRKHPDSYRSVRRSIHILLLFIALGVYCAFYSRYCSAIHPPGARGALEPALA